MSVTQPAAAGSGRRIVKVSRLTIAEAKLRMTLDRRLGRKTHPVVAKIAAAKPLPPAAR